MLSKLLSILGFLAKILPTVIADATGTEKKITSGGGVLADIHAGLDGALKVLSDIAGVL